MSDESQTQASTGKREMEYAAASDTGRVRKRNEDACGLVTLDDSRDHVAHEERASGTCPADNLLAIVCDGMGGGNAGDYASRFVVDQLPRELGRRLNPEAVVTTEDAGRLLREAVEEAHFKLIEEGRKDAGRAGMGTTLSAIWLRGDRVCTAQVGDSRIYRYRDGALQQLTTDQSQVGRLHAAGRITEEESLHWAGKNIVEQAMGMEEQPLKVVIDHFEYRKGDLFLLCSDGLIDRLLRDDLQEIFSSAIAREGTLAAAAEALIDEGNRASGRDNLTALLLAERESLAHFQAAAKEQRKQPVVQAHAGGLGAKAGFTQLFTTGFLARPISRLFFGLGGLLLFMAMLVVSLILANINSARTASVHAEVENLTGTVEQLVAAVEELETGRQETGVEANRMFERLDERTRDLTADINRLSAAVSHLRPLPARLDEAEQRIEDLKDSLKKNVQQASDGERALHQEFTGRLMTIRESLHELNGRVKALESSTNGVEDSAPADPDGSE